MKSSWFPIFMIAALLGLLVLLATLQYQWLGQISNAEQTRLSERLQDDTRRLAEDFNREIQTAYFLFQSTSEDWGSFSKRYEVWKEKTSYPNLIKDFYFVKTINEDELLKYDKNKGNFENSVWTEELKNIRKSFADEENYDQFSQDGLLLIVPIYKDRIDLKQSVGNEKKTITLKNTDGKVITESIVGPNVSGDKVNQIIEQFKSPKKEGFLIIRLDENVLKGEILHNLTKKYFSDSDGGRYKLSIADKNNSIIFQTHNETLEQSDAKVKLYDINQTGAFFFARDGNIPIIKSGTNDKVIFRNSISTTSIRTRTNTDLDKDGTIDINIINNNRINNNKPHITTIEHNFSATEGLWLLNVQHNDGSLEQFITNTRRRNLAISFGILALLAVSIIIIFLSSQRAKLLAQRQMDFVSSVSHEFRTPLAVIYSAGENLSDGVIDEKHKISSYGTLIKREGKKLSGMVEQILEFAGANSGKRKYDFREVEIGVSIKNALAECQTVIEENNFEVEQHIYENLPSISADEKAITLAIQNLINNSLKYCNGTKWIKVSAQNSGETIKISVEDKGIGISDKDKKQIFEPFYRAENVIDEQISGNGLGLSLVKQIVDAHNGKIEVESEVGKGSKFIIHLPVNK